MEFGNTKVLIYLAGLVPAVAVFLFWARRRARRDMASFAEEQLVPQIAPFFEKDRKTARAMLNLGAVFLLIFAAAGPRWGYFFREYDYRGLDLVIAVDVSRSMLAADMPPNRLEYARNEVEEFVRQLHGDRVGLIAFSGKAFMQCPITADRRGFYLALASLGTETIPRGGTSLENAIKEALRSYEGAETTNRILIVITDGESTEGDISGVLREAEEAGVMISCVGIGTPEGRPIPVIDEKGKKTLLKDSDGNVVRASLDEDALKQIASSTGGVYVRAEGGPALQKIYREKLSAIERKVKKGEKVKVYKERFQLPLLLAVFLLCVELFLRGKSA
ncbi:MAG: VWA domain-containing protein [Candidatus Omnitrophica bacterium]|nr:VWA domain-containing protein [Candidatus Omnitrophota bacterium]